MLVEHFLRVGYYDSALFLAKHFDIEDLTNINLFLVAKDVEEALAETAQQLANHPSMFAASRKRFYF